MNPHQSTGTLTLLVGVLIMFSTSSATAQQSKGVNDTTSVAYWKRRALENEKRAKLAEVEAKKQEMHVEKFMAETKKQRQEAADHEKARLSELETARKLLEECRKEKARSKE